MSRSIEEGEEGRRWMENEGGEKPICAMRSYIAPSPETGDYTKKALSDTSVVPDRRKIQ